jgi:hypothetical protein
VRPVLVPSEAPARPAVCTLWSLRPLRLPGAWAHHTLAPTRPCPSQPCAFSAVSSFSYPLLGPSPFPFSLGICHPRERPLSIQPGDPRNWRLPQSCSALLPSSASPFPWEPAGQTGRCGSAPALPTAMPGHPHACIGQSPPAQPVEEAHCLRPRSCRELRAVSRTQGRRPAQSENLSCVGQSSCNKSGLGVGPLWCQPLCSEV